MSRVDFSINGKPYSVDCPMGQEAYIQSLATIINTKVGNLAMSFRDADQETLILMAAILTTGELEKIKFRKDELENQRAKFNENSALEDELASTISDLAAKVKSIALKIES